MIRGDTTNLPLLSDSLDAVYSGYGIKTLSDEMRKKFAKETLRVLKPDGKFSLVEVCEPASKPMQLLQYFYMYQLMPLAFSTMPENYQRFLEINTYLFKFNGGTALENDFREMGAQNLERTPMMGGLTMVLCGHK